MKDQILELILSEGKWLTLALSLAIIIALLIQYKKVSQTILRNKILILMNLVFGLTIGIMAFGHLLAVSIKLIMGTLEGSIILFYFIGITLAVPSWWLVYYTLSRLNSEKNSRIIVILNSANIIALLAVGVFNLPLAIPAFLNIGYSLNKHKKLGYLIVFATIIFYLLLFIGSIIFFASGKSFEDFQGIN